MTELKPYAQWTNDCQGKKDFDGPILSLSTRYWPGPEGGGTIVIITPPVGPVEISTVPYGARPSAHSAIHLRLGPQEPHDGGGDYRVWREAEFSGDTEAEVMAQVEAWGSEQMRQIVNLLGGILEFRKP
jgi:hypothetical protein